jgi:DNA-directed RNA polymerase specialized sigma24 family protein
VAAADDGGATSEIPPNDVAAAAEGDQRAWDRLVDRHAQRVWSAARSFGLDAGAAADVCHLTWARLVEHLDELSTEERLCEWLVTTATHEARRDACARRSSRRRLSR